MRNQSDHPAFRRSGAHPVAFVGPIWLGLVLWSALSNCPILAQTTAPLEDLSTVDWKQLGVARIEPRQDAKTGFVVGGRNPTAIVRQLTGINGRAIADLERDMRPGADSDVSSLQGFLGHRERLLDVLARDNQFVVDEQRLDHQSIGAQLRVLAAIGSRRQGRPFIYRGVRFEVAVTYSRGFQLSPFRDGTKSNTDVVVTNLDNEQQLEYSLLVPLMIERYGFYEGRETPYRVEPSRVLEVLTFLRP